MASVLRAGAAAMMHQVTSVKAGHRITDSWLGRWLCGDDVEVAVLRCGAKAVVPLRDYNGRAMYLWGESDPRITGVIGAVVEAGDVVLDIGANLGLTGLYTASKVGPSGRVHLFEPQPDVAQLLRTSVQINGYGQAVIHECALSDREGTVEMEVAGAGNLGMTKIPTGGASSGRRITVLCEEAGRYIGSLGCGRVPLVKIDVEGHEAVILRSMKEQLREMETGVILFECHVGEQGFWHEDSVAVLDEMGFEFLAFDLRPIWRTKLYSVTKEMKKPAGHDFVAVHPKYVSPRVRARLEAMKR